MAHTEQKEELYKRIFNGLCEENGKLLVTKFIAMVTPDQEGDSSEALKHLQKVCEDKEGWMGYEEFREYITRSHQTESGDGKKGAVINSGLLTALDFSILPEPPKPSIEKVSSGAIFIVPGLTGSALQNKNNSWRAWLNWPILAYTTFDHK